jgi:hypothetical protein
MRPYLIAAAAALLACGQNRESADILITGGTVITMNADR